MKWKEAIIRVLEEEGVPMHYKDILEEIDNKGYKIDYNGKTTKNSVNSILSRNKSLFNSVGNGFYELVGTSVTAAHHSSTAGLTPGRTVPVVVRPSTAYAPGDPNYKTVSYFITSEVPSDKEKELLELIVNFRLPLETDEVCFADIVDNLEVEFSDKKKPRPKSKDIDKTHLQKKLDKLRKQIAKIENKAQSNPNLLEDPLFNRMRSAAKEAKQLLQKDSGENVEFDEITLLGEFVPGDSPKVVIYYKNIEHISSQRWDVMAGVFIHEMFHAWDYFRAGKMSSSVMAIDEPMVEFETLYFLKELETYTRSQSHPLKDNVSSVSEEMKDMVQEKQQSIGDVAAYGFGYYLFEKLNDYESRYWIEGYYKKSASIDGSDESVKKAVNALIPIYPFKSDAKVMNWFKEIIF